jgi:hypothetical protein
MMVEKEGEQEYGNLPALNTEGHMPRSPVTLQTSDSTKLYVFSYTDLCITKFIN